MDAAPSDSLLLKASANCYSRVAAISSLTDSFMTCRSSESHYDSIVFEFSKARNLTESLVVLLDLRLERASLKMLFSLCFTIPPFDTVDSFEIPTLSPVSFDSSHSPAATCLNVSAMALCILSSIVVLSGLVFFAKILLFLSYMSIIIFSH